MMQEYFVFCLMPAEKFADNKRSCSYTEFCNVFQGLAKIKKECRKKNRGSKILKGCKTGNTQMSIPIYTHLKAGIYTRGNRKEFLSKNSIACKTFTDSKVNKR